MSIRSNVVRFKGAALLFAVLSMSGVVGLAQDSPQRETTTADPIAAARAAIAADTSSGEAHLQLGKALGQAIFTNPELGGQYGGEMLSSLQTAIELDPKLAEAYEWLGNFYVNAPTFAGGSLVEAEKVARQLIEIDAKRGNALFEMVKQRTSAGGH